MRTHDLTVAHMLHLRSLSFFSLVWVQFPDIQACRPGTGMFEIVVQSKKVHGQKLKCNLRKRKYSSRNQK